jgi:hypothetical protein
VKNQKPSRRGSVSGAPCGTGMGDGAWGWHGGTYQVVVVVVVGSCGCETRGEGGLGEKPETEPCETAVADGAWGWRGGTYQAAARLCGCET